MASQKFSSELIAKRYAISLYELSSENKCIEEVLKDLLIIEEYIKRNNDFNLLVRSPLISSKEKLKILQKILSDHSANVLTSKFIQVISYNKRINFLSSIIKKFIAINAEKRGDIIADITSAEELTGHQKDIIKNQLRLILGKKLSPNFTVDKKIIGGLIVKIGSKMIDSSLDSKINKLTIAMKGT